MFLFVTDAVKRIILLLLVVVRWFALAVAQLVIAHLIALKSLNLLLLFYLHLLLFLYLHLLLKLPLQIFLC